MDCKILSLLDNNQIKNDPQLKFWIYKVETIFASGKRYLKIYLFNRNFDDKQPDLITFAHANKDYPVSNFSIVSEYNDKNIIGGFFEIPVEDYSIDVIVKKEIVDGKVYESSGIYVDYKCQSFPSENEYLKEKFPLYSKNCQVYPQINGEWWQCSCGRIYPKNNELCTCGQTLINNKELIEFDFEENHIQDYLNKGIEYDVNKSFEDNVKSFGESINSKHGIDAHKLIDRINYDDEQNKYNLLVSKDLAKKKKKKKIRTICIVTSLTLIIAIVCLFSFAPEYKLYFEYRFLTNNYREQYQGLSQISVLDSTVQADKAFKKRMESLYKDKKYSDIVTMIRGDNKYVTTITLSENDFKFIDSEMKEIYDDSRYEDALILLEKKQSLSSVIKTLENLGDYKDSKSKLKDAKWAYIKQNYDNYNTTTYKYLTELKNQGYTGASSAYNELYDWKVKVIINDGASSVKYYEKTDITIKASGGIPNTKKKMRAKIEFPNGDYDYSANDWVNVYSGGDEWGFYFQNGCMTGPRFNGSYLTITILDENNDVLGVGSIRVTK